MHRRKLWNAVVVLIMFAFTVYAFYGLAEVGRTDIRSGPCLEFAYPRTVFCNIEKTPLLSELATHLCFYNNPPRWVLTSTSREDFTVIGGECFTAFEGRN